MNALAARLARVLDLLDREARHLAEVTQRFFGDAEAIDRQWIERQLAVPEGIDRLESFGAKISRLQDTLSDKLLPLFLRVAGELPGTAVENLHRAERLGIIRDTQEWLGARGEFGRTSMPPHQCEPLKPIHEMAKRTSCKYSRESVICTYVASLVRPVSASVIALSH